MTTPTTPAPETARRWWQVAAPAVALLITLALTAIAFSRSSISYALPGGSGSVSFGPGMLASVVDVFCLAALVVLLVMTWQRRRPQGLFWSALLIPLAIAIILTIVAVTAETPNF